MCTAWRSALVAGTWPLARLEGVPSSTGYTRCLCKGSVLPCERRESRSTRDCISTCTCVVILGGSLVRLQSETTTCEQISREKGFLLTSHDTQEGIGLLTGLELQQALEGVHVMLSMPRGIIILICELIITAAALHWLSKTQPVFTQLE